MIQFGAIPRISAVFLLSMVLTGSFYAQADDNEVKITVIPDKVYVETGEFSQHLNFDILVENLYQEELTIAEILIHAYDGEGELITRKMVNTNGFNPGINTLGVSSVGAGDSLFVYNPFSLFNPGFTIGKIQYAFQFQSESGEVVRSDMVVFPEYYQTRTDLVLPVKERVIVYDGHDLYSHHRRVDLTHPILQQIGITRNPSRYAYDLCVVNEKGELFENEGERNEDWFGYGAAIYSPADGIVVEMFNDMPDNVLGTRMFDFEQVLENPKTMAGNYVIIDHQNGEYSMLGHFKQGSIKLHEGESIRQGQLIGQLGFSGSTGHWVHLHYELRDGIEMWSSEGVPSYFSGFNRILGTKIVAEERGLINTGDIVEASN